MQTHSKPTIADAFSSLVVFLIALPLCLGIALACGTPLLSGIIAGVVGGIVVGLISGSHTSVSGPAAGLTAVVIAQIQQLGSFECFLLAVVLAGLIQIGLGVAKAGGLSVFFPTSVIKGLMAAIGVILILKQLPHLLGHDEDPEGDFSFFQQDQENTFSEIGRLFYGEFHDGAMTVGLAALIFLLIWDRIPKLKKSPVPASVVVVALGVALAEVLKNFGDAWEIGSTHLVAVPVVKDIDGFTSILVHPDWSKLIEPKVYLAAVTLALVASLETLLNLEAVDKLDPFYRRSPSNRELIAQGVGNVASGLVGGLPVTSVIVRSSANINSGAKSKWSAVLHGVMLALAVFTIPTLLNKIPLACLAAILIVTGLKLASLKLFQQIIQEGKYQYLPFFLTLFAIIFTDLLIGIGIGLAISIAFILYSNLSSPVRAVLQPQVGGDILHVKLSSQVSFLNRASLEDVLYTAKPGTNVLIDATGSDYIDPDIVSLFRDFRDSAAKVRGITVSTRGFENRFNLSDSIEFAEYTTQELQKRLSPNEVIDFLKLGNERFRTGKTISRNLGHQIEGTKTGQHPLAIVLSCIDSRSPAELIFDLGIGDIFTVRIAGNVVKSKVIGSIEYACAIAGAKLIVVMGHTYCGAINASIELAVAKQTALQSCGCQHLDLIVNEIQKSIDRTQLVEYPMMSASRRLELAQSITRNNVLNSMKEVLQGSEPLNRLVAEGKVGIIGAIYHVESGAVDFLELDQFA